ncbi:vascular endothelial growth factor A-A isoform X1 [Brienomyrus brachyistius]|uniref:vascular endothelial growth factor A-A isoform X1 n=1 Tax=Brienomyrus brachyistius TaxID=42636 RepID=UPI0020B298A7|nr:vascular endothelial growth factor A-A isoform X1 [Brienomyrus brachyistius]XP_048882040.1 vascular endothelial growth factor A-A isoform X1 [Brienomyrus brachyistius]XP_048882041.1 vascular endothelial growth factor A-A isoform X1 [Brienomyrus brachyistius]XP_048882042.1 vascular endothelial growth factor A-A isoform X1 [Brienomyrus brachyistius]XP_048882043.1 vascular endothelial growth factor A-A isoform X1 [Brienomyrus brachyistius]
MNLVVNLILELFLAALHLSFLKAAHIPKDREKSKNEVVPFMDVFNKSLCQPREVLVDIFQEYPDETEVTYIPSCVALIRCGGCCNDEAMECVPTETFNTTMEVIRIKQRVQQQKFLRSFTEHRKCECRPKTDVKENKENHCAPCSEKRRRYFVQDPLTCQCSCKNSELDCKARSLELNQRTCRCEKPRR